MSEEATLDQQSEQEPESETKAGVMTKAELVDEVARVVQLTKKQAETIVNIVFDSIVDSLRAGQKIELRGFGSFRLRSRKSRTGAIRRPERKWKYRRKRFRTSSREKS